MICTAADDPGRLGAPPPCRFDMSVLELAIFLGVFRGERPLPIAELPEMLHRWFECEPDKDELAALLGNMFRRGWLEAAGEQLRATRAGREFARPLLQGLIRMIDQGTRLLDVALMMSVLRLTKGELDADRA